MDRPSRLRAVVAPAALLVCSILLTLLALEGVVRSVGISVGTSQISRRLIKRSTNASLLYELQSNATANAEVDYRTNSHGMRDREFSEVKPSGTTRIAVIGDSIAFGWWVDEASLFSRQLERLLNMAGSSRVQVLNFGVPGYNLQQEAERLRTDVLRFSPDLALVAFCLNDMRKFSRQYGMVLDRASRRSALTGRITESLLERSMFLSWIEYRAQLLETRRPSAREGIPHRSHATTLGADRTELAAGFAAVADALRPKAIPGLVAVFPLFSVRFEDYPYREVHREVIETAEEAGLLAVDLLPCFSAYKFRDVRVDEVHPSPLGHRVAAHSVLEALCGYGLVCTSRTLVEGTCGSYRPAEFRRVRGY